jgi:perosamine synthetase
MAAGIRSGAEVITTPFSFVASANCILYVGAKPVFVDIDPVTLNLDASKAAAKINGRTKALLPVHVFGRPCDMDSLLDLAHSARLFTLEDACEAIGAKHGGRYAGTIGNAGVYAFYPNKQMTTGEGGMIVTKDDKFADLCRSLRNQGREKGSAWLEHARLGYNFRMTEMQAALGLSQLRRLTDLMACRARVAGWYHDLLHDCSEIMLPGEISPDITLSWFVYVVVLRENWPEGVRNQVMSNLRERGIECATYFPPIHLQSHFRERFHFRRGDFPVTESIASRTIALPFYSRISREEVERVTFELRRALRAVSRPKRG